MNICIFGASSEDMAPVYFEETEKLGREIGKRGWGIVFGGGARGLMGAAAKGVYGCGGPVCGVAPHFFDRPGILFESCSELILTETMRERKQKMEELSDAFVVLPGGIGTLEEFFEVLTLKQLAQHKKPIVLYNIAGYYADLCRLLERTAAEGFMIDECLKLFAVLDSPEACLSYIENYKPTEFDMWKMKYRK
jgi:uncharacterized protein (TIGR00730 family)